MMKLIRKYINEISLYTLIILLYVIEFYIYRCIYFTVGVNINYNLVSSLVIISLALIIFNFIISLIDVKKKKSKEDLKRRIDLVFKSKIFLIPFYIWNLYLLIAISLKFIVLPGVDLFLFIPFVSVVWSYGIMLTTSIPGVISILTFYKGKKNSLPLETLYIILQFILGIDIISYIVFYIINSKSLKPKEKIVKVKY